MGRPARLLTPERIARAIKLREEGIGYAEIARRLGGTRQSWIARLGRHHRHADAVIRSCLRCSRPSRPGFYTCNGCWNQNRHAAVAAEGWG